MTDKEVMEKALEAAYLAGFKASGEGYNGDYPFGDKNQNPEHNVVWCKDRDNTLQEALAKQCTYPNCDYPCTNLPDCQEQKPVKWSDYESDGVHHNKPSLAKQEQGEPMNTHDVISDLVKEEMRYYQTYSR